MSLAVGEAAHAWHRHRTRSAASGPVFTIPALPSGAAVAAPQLAPTAPACPSPPSTGTSRNLTSFLGRTVGNGQCVALARAVQPSLGSTATWTAGASVQGNTALPVGTVIATFDHSGHYANATDGSSHAAVYLGQDASGLQVLDQWAGKEASVRTIPWSRPGAAAANVGATYRVVAAG
jgi:hypothetical protein